MTIDEIRAALHARAADVCGHLLPAGRRDGDEYVVGSLVGESGGSLKINLNGKCGVWRDFATDDGGDNLLELWRCVRGHNDIRETMREAAEWLGHDARSDRGTVAGEWTYTDPDGKPWLRVVRRDLDGGKKRFAQYDIRAKQWITKGGHQLPTPRPLYGLHRFVHQPASEIVLVEGEKCADALNRLGILATTTLGGCGQIRRADFSPLRGWRVSIWRDADDAGSRYAETAAEMLREAGAAEVLLVPVPTDKPEGWDVADAALDGWTAAEIRAQIETAEPVTGPESPAATPGRFVFVSDTEIEEMPAPTWRIQELILAESVVQCVGAPGTMKSFLALAMAAHVRTGTPFSGRAVQSAPVLYVLAEGVRAFGLRLRAWKLHHGHSGGLGLWFLPGPVQLASVGELTEFLTKLKELQDLPRFVIIDTQARCSVGLEENSNSDMGLLIAGAERIQRETRGAVMLIHHTPRDGDRERGAVAQRGGVDTTLLVSADGDFVTVTVSRQKDGADGDVLTFRRRIIELDEGRTSCVLVPDSSEGSRAPLGIGDLPRSVRTLVDTLRTADGNVSSAQLRKITGLADRTFFDALARAKKWELIGGTNRGYLITAAGRELFT